MLPLYSKQFMHPDVVPNFKTCRKRKIKKRQWFFPQDCPQLVQVSSKKKQWFPPQKGAEVHEVDVNMQEKVPCTVKFMFYAYHTFSFLSEVHEVGVIVQVQFKEAAQVEEVEQVEPTAMSTPKKIVKRAVRKLTPKKVT
jgi:hypothetical protein